MRKLLLGALLYCVSRVWAAAPYAYVANSYDSTVSVIDWQKKTVVATIPVVDTPAAITVSDDGKNVYVAGTYGVSIIDTATNTGTGAIFPNNFFSGESLAVSPNGETLYVGVRSGICG